MKYCPNCNREYPDDSGFCGVCGCQLETRQEYATGILPHTCSKCGCSLDANMAFCPTCGAPVGMSAPVQTSPAHGSAPFNGGYVPPQPVAPKNDAFTNGAREFAALLKDYFTQPSKAFENITKMTSPVPGIFATAVTFLAFFIFLLCIFGKFDMELSTGIHFGGAFLISLLSSLFSIAVPMLTSFVSVKVAKRNASLLSVFSAHSISMLPIDALLIVTGLLGIISLELAFGLLFIAMVVKVVTSVSVVNHLNGGLFETPKTMWATLGVTAGLKIFEVGFIFAIAKAVLESMFYEIVWSLF